MFCKNLFDNNSAVLLFNMQLILNPVLLALCSAAKHFSGEYVLESFEGEGICGDSFLLEKIDNLSKFKLTF